MEEVDQEKYKVKEVQSKLLLRREPDARVVKSK
jgi:hypothetical protein